MTLGQRLSELRAQRGLSQLELAEALDVSRQSVSKWETDAAVPEIDKLIALSRYFGVSIGALLGVEPETDEASAPDGELTEAQLKMVEEIVDRYVAALPKPMPKERRLALRIAALVAAVCLAAGLLRIFRQLSELHENYNNLASSVGIVNANVGGITARVEAALEKQTRITADASAELVSADLAANTVTLALRATPKVYADGMAAYFEIENGGAHVSVGPVEPVGTTFSAESTVALTDELKIYVVFVSNGQRETQLLDEYLYLYTDTRPSIFLSDCPSYTYYWKSNTRAAVKGEWYVMVQPDPDSSRAWSVDGRDDVLPRAKEVTSVEVGLFRDRRLLWWAERMDGAPEDWPEDLSLTHWYFCYPDSASAFEPGGAFEQGELCSVARVTDEFGRVFLFGAGDGGYALAEDGTLEWRQGEAGAVYGAPLDPSGWDFTPWE